MALDPIGHEQRAAGIRAAADSYRANPGGHLAKVVKGRSGGATREFLCAWRTFDHGGAVHARSSIANCVKSYPCPLFLEQRTLPQLADAIVKEQSADPAVVIVPLQTAGQRPPVFLMPSMSGAPALSSKLLACLDAERPVFALGLAGDDAPWGERTTLPEIARHCVTAIRETSFAGPIHLMGHSFGGILAYEVARSCVTRESRLAVSRLSMPGWRRFPDIHAGSLCGTCHSFSPTCPTGLSSSC